MNVLVTGAGGFIGSHLVEDQLKKGRKVTALDLDFSSLNGSAAHGQLQKITGDIRNKELMECALARVDVVFHLASAHLSLTTSEKDYWDINVTAAKDLVDLCRTSGVKRFVHCSSVGIYGDVVDAPANEESSCAPDLVYDRTKLAGEQSVTRFYQETGYPISIIRPVWVYGPRCPRTNKLFKSIGRQRFPMVGAGRNLRHCIYISDLIDAFELCATRDEAVGQTFIFGDEAAVTVAQLVNEIALVMNVAPPKVKIPLKLARPLCSITESVFRVVGREPPLSKRTLEFFTRNTNFDITKAKRLLDFVPRVKLHDGLTRTYQYIVENSIQNSCP
jgi:nucleoside-diphosphate-sugar epimerase